MVGFLGTSSVKVGIVVIRRRLRVPSEAARLREPSAAKIEVLNIDEKPSIADTEISDIEGKPSIGVINR